MERNKNYLEIKNIEKRFGKVEVLKGISISINRGEFVCFLGPSGCGKTTLLRIISGLEELNSGEVILDNKNVTKLTPAKRNLGMVFQSYALFPNMTAYKNIEFGLKSKKCKKNEIKNKIKKILEMVDLIHVSDKYPNEMSGGQQQRISLARAIALEPNILLLDEPLSALDAKVRENLRKEIKKIQKNMGITTIMVTHDQEEALTMADKIVVMNGGEVMQIGTPEEIYKKPANRFVADFIGKINFLNDLEGESVLIRPEELLYSEKEKIGYTEGVITQIEFRGAFYRISLDIDGEEVLLDLLSKEKKNLKLSLGERLYIKSDSKEV